VLSGEETNTNLFVFGLTRLWLERMIHWTRGEHDMVCSILKMLLWLWHVEQWYSCTIIFVQV